MNCHEMRNRKRNRETSALPATSLINKREKCFSPNKKKIHNPKTENPPEKSEKYVRPMAGQLAARCFLHNMQQFVARPDVYNKINNISRVHSIPINIKIRFEFEFEFAFDLHACSYNSLRFCLLRPIKVASGFII